MMMRWPAMSRPVDRELFNRTAPRWNCVAYTDGMHYIPGKTCLWCGKSRAEIAREENHGTRP